jgi:hypothetical protein
MSGSADRQRRTTHDTEPQASQATRQARHEASGLRDEEAAGSNPVTPTWQEALADEAGNLLNRDASIRH